MPYSLVAAFLLIQAGPETIPYQAEIAILTESSGAELAARKRKALLRLSESDDIEALKILHRFHFQSVRKPETLKGLTPEELRDLRYFSAQLLRMKKATERLAEAEPKPAGISH